MTWSLFTADWRALSWRLAMAASLALAPHAASQPDPASVDEQALQRSVEQLQSGDWITRWQAMRDLARWKSPQAVGPLVQVLRSDAHPWLRGRALVALAEIRGRAVMPQVTPLIDSGDPELRAAAAEAVGIIGDTRSTTSLFKLLKDKDKTVQAKALEAYARVGGDNAWSFVAGGLEGEDPIIARHAMRALPYLPREQVAPKVLQMLQSDKPEKVQLAAASAGMLQLSEAVTPLLSAAAGHEKSEVRQSAREALQLYDVQAITPQLTQAITGSDPAVAAPAIALLARGGDPSDLQPLLQYLQRLDPAAADERTVLLMNQLARSHAEAIVPVLQRFVQSGPVEVRQEAIRQLATAPGVDAYEALRPALSDTDPSIAAAALRALADAELEGAPREGIVAYLKPAISAEADSDAFPSDVVALVRSAATQEEYAQARALFKPMLVGSTNWQLRRQAAEVLDRLSNASERAQIAAEQRWIAPWAVIGPFAPDAEASPLEAMQGGGELDLGRTYAAGDRTQQWHVVAPDSPHGDTTVSRPLEDLERGQVIYAAAVVEADRELELQPFIDVNAARSIYLNGSLVAEQDEPGEARFSVTFPAGRSTLLLRITLPEGSVGLRMRLELETSRSTTDVRQVAPQP